MSEKETDIIDQIGEDMQKATDKTVFPPYAYFLYNRAFQLRASHKALEKKLEGLEEAIKFALPALSIPSKDFEKLRVQEFEKFNVHSLDFILVNFREAIAPDMTCEEWSEFVKNQEQNLITQGGPEALATISEEDHE